MVGLFSRSYQEMIIERYMSLCNFGEEITLRTSRIILVKDKISVAVMF